MGIKKVVSIEFGPESNWVMTQGASEAWALGNLERLKRDLRTYEQTYTTHFKKIGVGINQLLLLATIIVLPGLSTLADRTILMLGVLAIIYGINRLHGRYLPIAAIYLMPKPVGAIARLAPSAISWLIAVTASIAAALLAAYLQGYIGLPVR